MWQHVGRSWSDTHLEDECPCPKVACGLVDEGRTDPTCSQHPVGRAKTMRQRHFPIDCPARVVIEDVEVVEDDKPPVLKRAKLVMRKTR
jgi:hypothetical protein